jgi:hypothetical protein
MYDFLILNLFDKASLLLNKGTFLMNYTNEKLSYALYAFKDYYVEAVVNKEENRITDIVPFQNGWRLDKYLSELFVDLDSIC